ncbi:MarR family winged helix-turn-helix transcriptional regulator [Streptomyces sp. NPDC058221]|uniref:MarR family winged helix-turn-helix transcriptional regulator n=1 Tax=Streptomyces sp. NPDC058221 TaxID=3346388 RepID=UPI0036EC2100
MPDDVSEVPDVHALMTGFTDVVGPLLDRTGAIFAAERVPFSQASLLVELHERGAPQRMVALAQAQGVVPRTVTSLLDGLERRGLVIRNQDPDDRRVVLVSLTADGAALMEQIGRTTADFAGNVFAALLPDERSELSRLLAKVSPAAREGGHGHDR